ncbi:uncharacterized protein [Antedon mediterranea]|uniref:uncharacterized protein n=1 Tax=Antedon mediterranea TaxID=105859 RepID=UPI003AF90300
MDDVEVVIPTVEELSRQPEKNVPCPEEGCDMIFKTRPSLHMHVVKTHGLVQNQSESITYGRGGKRKSRVKVFYCPVENCSRSVTLQKPFNRRNSLRQHFFVCHGEKSFVCCKCGRGFGTATTQKRHETICGQIFHCSCQCPFKSKESLLMHAKRQGHIVPVQYQNLQLPKKPKTTKTNHQVLMNVLPKCAQNQVSSSTPKLQFILPKPKVLSVSQAASLHPKNTTLVTVNNGVITDIKEIMPVQTRHTNFPQTVNLDIKNGFSNEPSIERPQLSDAQAQWSAMDTADWQQDSTTNTHLNNQVLPEMLTVGTNFPGIAETDAHTQTNMPANANVNFASDMSLGNSVSDALVQTMPYFRVEPVAPDPLNPSGQNMETQTSSDLLVQAMVSAILQRQDVNQDIINQHSIVVTPQNYVNQPLNVTPNNFVGANLNIPCTSSSIQPITVRASSETQTQHQSTMITPPNYVTSSQYVPTTNQGINIPQTNQVADNVASLSKRKRSFQKISSLNLKVSSDTQTTMNLENTDHLLGEYDDGVLNLSQESRNGCHDKSIRTIPSSTSYLTGLEHQRSCSGEAPHKSTIPLNMEECQTERNTIGIQAENDMQHGNNEQSGFSTIDLMDPFPDFGDVFLESIATQTYSNEQLRNFNDFLHESPHSNLADNRAPTSPLLKNIMGESFEDLLHTDSGSQTDEFQDFIFENQFIENTVKSVTTNYSSGNNQESISMKEHPLDQDAVSVHDDAHNEGTNSSVEQLKDISKSGKDKLLLSETMCKNDSEVVSSIVSDVDRATAVHTGAYLNKSVVRDKEGDNVNEYITTDKMKSYVHQTIERGDVEFSDVETQADIYPFKRSRLSAEMSHNETQTKFSNIPITSSNSPMTSSGGVAKTSSSSVAMTSSSSVAMTSSSSVAMTSSGSVAMTSSGSIAMTSSGSVAMTSSSSVAMTSSSSVAMTSSSCVAMTSSGTIAITSCNSNPITSCNSNSITLCNNNPLTSSNSNSITSYSNSITSCNSNPITSCNSNQIPLPPPAANHRKVTTSEYVHNAHRSSTQNQIRDAPTYCNAEIQADIIVVNRNKDDTTGSAGTTSVETQTRRVDNCLTYT